ncbi:MAG: hypothetical protein AAGA66_08550 [Bacteroidota bacterium]
MYQNIHASDRVLLNETEQTIYQAAQFLAMFGKGYAEKQPDDSHTNLEFLSEKSTIVSRVEKEKGISLFLDVPRWRLGLEKEKVEVASLPITNHTQEEIIRWVRHELNQQGLDGDKFQEISHYTIPEHPTQHGSPFSSIDLQAAQQWSVIRANANLIMSELTQLIGMNSDFCIWPHHFDTGAYYPLGEQKGIGTGWAMTDVLCDQPYLYLYGVNGMGDIGYVNAPPLTIGRWVLTNEWQGAIVSLKEIASVEDQWGELLKNMKLIVTFFLHELIPNRSSAL